MDDVLLMQVADAFDYLNEDPCYICFRELILSIFDEFIQVLTVNVLCNKVHFGVLLECINHLEDIRMRKRPENLNFSQLSFKSRLRFITLFNYLYCSNVLFFKAWYTLQVACPFRADILGLNELALVDLAELALSKKCSSL